MTHQLHHQDGEVHVQVVDLLATLVEDPEQEVDLLVAYLLEGDDLIQAETDE